jgi:hypothetical protein
MRPCIDASSKGRIHIVSKRTPCRWREVHVADLKLLSFNSLKGERRRARGSSGQDIIDPSLAGTRSSGGTRI